MIKKWYEDFEMDHRIVHKNGIMFFPYNLNIGELFLMEKLAEKHDMDIHISPSSAYGNGTFEVSIDNTSEREWLKPQIDKIREKVKNREIEFS